MRPENENSLTHEKPSPNNAGAILFVSGLVVKEVFLRVQNSLLFRISNEEKFYLLAKYKVGCCFELIFSMR